MNRANKRNLFFSLILGFSAVIGVACVTGLVWYHKALQPPVSSGQARDIYFKVSEGMGASRISDELFRRGLIKSSLAFKLLARDLGVATGLKAGIYRLSPTMTAQTIVDTMVQGKVADRKVTIPEGLTAGQIATLLESKKIIKSADSFIEVVKKKKLEGRLYPETYLIPVGTSDDAVIEIMVDRFEKVTTERLGHKVTSSPEFESTLIMASIIEREAKRPQDRPLIASVFANRMAKDMRLESCATVQYALGRPKGRLLYKDLEIESPYNTYIHSGLPPGPICNPGIASIEAAARPAETAFLFFVAQSDGTHIFSKSYREHQLAIKRTRAADKGVIR